MDTARDTWQFWIDRGGTFTDVIGKCSDGRLVVHKLLSENPAFYDDAAVQGMHDILKVSAGEPLPLERISLVKMGTTVATNALLERKGERTLLVVNRGFADVLKIGYQNRPQIFARQIILPELLYETVVEVPGRLDFKGTELEPFDDNVCRRQLQMAFDLGIRSCAIVFMHGYRYTEHERRCAAIASAVGFEQISTSHEVSPLIKFVSRGDTTVADAYLSPILNRYLNKLTRDLGSTRMYFMQSNGGHVDKAHFRGKDSLLSGPAGGVVGAVKASRFAGKHKIIGFDMGGTSTDVFHYDGQFERQMESEISGITIRVPMMSVTTVAAGGGSIVSYDSGRFRVGPHSAGAKPGPACYRNGGPLTVTDCNLALGRINAAHFPAVFGEAGDRPLDTEIVETKFRALAENIRVDSPVLASQYDLPEKIAQGFLSVAVEKMAQAIKKVSIARGHDVTEYTLMSFGGAGGQHACLIAESLGIKSVLIHPLAGVLSALGIGLADTTVIRQASIQEKLEEHLWSRINQQFELLERESLDELISQGVAPEKIRVMKKLLVRYQGSDSTLLVDYDDAAAVKEQFHRLHQARYGFFVQAKDLVVEAVFVEGNGLESDEGLMGSFAMAEAGFETEKPAQEKFVALYSKGKWHDAPLYGRRDLYATRRIVGPALICEEGSTIIVESGWTAQCTTTGNLILEREPAARAMSPQPLSLQSADPVILELFNNMFMSVAEEMGVTLQQTSHSVNIKERLDFSCAIFDADGELIANAPHIPVHLGSMGESVQTIIASRTGSMKPGDVFVLNNPYHGGTHLPDVTVITPVFDTTGGHVLFFTASRGHHSDIGGITPGSMPPGSKSIEDEGVLIDDFQLVKEGEFLEKEMLSLLASGRHPARNPAQNISDLKAQIAANNRGVSGLSELVSRYGVETVRAYMQFVRQNAEQSVRQAISRLHDGRYTCKMDDGSHIDVTISVDTDTRSAVIDFSGTSLQQPSNFNAPRSICKAAVLYVFRTLIEDNIPLNAGCLVPLTIKIPEGSMLSPQYPAAVVAGNVETSQAIVDALYGALHVLAASQGTMNNFTFGDDEHQYYETVCGGSGAGPSFAGTDAVQTHMTNSRLTDPEVLEWRFPVVLESFKVRRGSGGAGKFRGGNGVIRRIRFQKPMTASILSGRRLVPPFGLEGGAAASTGYNCVERADGEKLELKGTDNCRMEIGDVFVIATPGGGGWGSGDDTLV